MGIVRRRYSQQRADELMRVLADAAPLAQRRAVINQDPHLFKSFRLSMFVMVLCLFCGALRHPVLDTRERFTPRARLARGWGPRADKKCKSLSSEPGTSASSSGPA